MFKYSSPQGEKGVIYFCQPYDWQKRRVFTSRRNIVNEELVLVCGGRLFHARAAATGKARSSSVVRRLDVSGRG